jgi:hypothetical protein
MLSGLPGYSRMRRYRTFLANFVFCSTGRYFADFEPSSERTNSRCISSTMVFNATLALLRSALPYLTPLIVQFAPSPDFGLECSMNTPEKSSQLGSAFLTRAVITSCNARGEIASLVSFELLNLIFGTTQPLAGGSMKTLRLPSRFCQPHRSLLLIEYAAIRFVS